MTDDIKANFKRYVDRSAASIAHDLTNLLNRAHALGVAICPDVDPNEGISYSVEWAFAGESQHMDVEWDYIGSEWDCK